ncbi:hypothetical protein KHS38_12110 [Mucilaginibacter sp. Bleaf8]|uniref:hypothetical protein n=1 Tax=Mucilaginibacter sp. Bleaf8 TaxID=2834430 RepID=UPI001BCB9870|nr:hypothetical protein [Mucilaginibacter sp. Bleaf8]MBS7565149.1 hypothetical protein [Mucilaginibacter sp. Bleaf8]
MDELLNEAWRITKINVRPQIISETRFVNDILKTAQQISQRLDEVTWRYIAIGLINSQEWDSVRNLAEETSSIYINFILNTRGIRVIYIID